MVVPPVEALRTGAPNAVLLLVIKSLRLEVSVLCYADEEVVESVSTATAKSTTTEP